MKNIFLFFLFLVVTKNLSAQDINQYSFKQLDSIIQEYLNLEEYKASLPFAQKAVEIATKTLDNNDTCFARMQFSLGAAYDHGIGDYEKALACYEIALKIQEEKIPTTANYAHTISFMAAIQTYHLHQQDGDVESKLLKALKIYQSTIGEENFYYTSAFATLVNFYSSIGNYVEAEKLSLQEIKLSKKVYGSTSYNYASSLNSLATIYSNMHQYEQAEPFFLQAIAIFKTTLGEADYSTAVLLNNLADMYSSMGKYEEAELMFLQALKSFAQIFGEESSQYTRILNNLGFLYKSIKKFDLAEKVMMEAKEKSKKLDGETSTSYARSLNNLALLYLDFKRYEEAEVCLVQAEKIIKKNLGETAPFHAQIINNQAILFWRTEQYEKAERYFLQTKNFRANTLGETHPHYANSLMNLALLYLTTNQIDSSIAYIWASLAVNSENFDEVFSDAFTQNTITLEKYNPSTCKKGFSSSDFLKLNQLNFRDITATNSTLDVLLGIAYKIYETASPSDKKEALKLYFNLCKTSLEINEKNRNEFASKDNKLHTLKKGSYYIEKGLHAALEFQQIDAPNYFNYIKDAFAFSEQNKSALLTDAIKSDRAVVWGDLPDSIAQKESQLLKEKDALKKLQHQAQTPEEKNAIITQTNNLNASIQAFLKTLKKDYPNYHQLRYENVLAKAEDVQQLLAPKTVLLEYYITDTVVYLFCLGNQGIELFPIKINQEEFQENIKNLRKSLSNYVFIVEKPLPAYQLYTSTAHWFYKYFVEVALKDKTVDNLIIVTDGDLGHLPFEAFLTKQAPQESTPYNKLNYLVNQYNISYNYSATLLLENRKTSPHNNGKMLALAASYPESSAWTTTLDSSLLERRLPHLVALRKNLIALPEAQKEVNALSENFEGDFLTGDAANEHFFKNNATQYGVIHLAMHGLLHPKVPMLSSLVFSENKDSLEDNFLEAYEISHLKLNADLVVLSACETGYGKFEQGEGILSMARSFMYAGVPSLVVSLWQVNDHSTGVIMKSFYGYLADGLTKDQALRQAKLDYISQVKGTACHPAFWSPFIQLGDSRPIYIKTKGGFFWWGIGLVGLVGLGGFAFVIGKRKKA